MTVAFVYQPHIGVTIGLTVMTILTRKIAVSTRVDDFLLTKRDLTTFVLVQTKWTTKTTTTTR